MSSPSFPVHNEFIGLGTKRQADAAFVVGKERNRNETVEKVGGRIQICGRKINHLTKLKPPGGMDRHQQAVLNSISHQSHQIEKDRALEIKRFKDVSRQLRQSNETARKLQTRIDRTMGEMHQLRGSGIDGKIRHEREGIEKFEQQPVTRILSRKVVTRGEVGRGKSLLSRLRHRLEFKEVSQWEKNARIDKFRKGKIKKIDRLAKPYEVRYHRIEKAADRLKLVKAEIVAEGAALANVSRKIDEIDRTADQYRHRGNWQLGFLGAIHTYEDQRNASVKKITHAHGLRYQPKIRSEARMIEKQYRAQLDDLRRDCKSKNLKALTPPYQRDMSEKLMAKSVRFENRMSLLDCIWGQKEAVRKEQHFWNKSDRNVTLRAFQANLDDLRKKLQKIPLNDEGDKDFEKIVDAYNHLREECGRVSVHQAPVMQIKEVARGEEKISVSLDSDLSKRYSGLDIRKEVELTERTFETQMGVYRESLERVLSDPAFKQLLKPEDKFVIEDTVANLTKLSKCSQAFSSKLEEDPSLNALKAAYNDKAMDEYYSVLQRLVQQQPEIQSVVNKLNRSRNIKVRVAIASLNLSIKQKAAVNSLDHFSIKPVQRAGQHPMMLKEAVKGDASFVPFLQKMEARGLKVNSAMPEAPKYELPNAA